VPAISGLTAESGMLGGRGALRGGPDGRERSSDPPSRPGAGRTLADTATIPFIARE